MSFILLDSKAFEHNLTVIKNIAPVEKIAVVLKDNAYGHGLLEMAILAKKNGIKHAVVRYVNEAQKISDIFQTVLVLADIPSSKISENINITINSMGDIKKIPKNTAVHLKVNSGMNRNGISMDELNSAILQIKEGGLLLKGIFSHSRSSDELSSELFWQYKIFQEIKAKSELICKDLGLEPLKFHFANSSALLRMKSDVVFDMVRVGIAIYGYSECDEVFNPPSLKPVLSLWGEKISSRVALKNQRVGYAGQGKVENDSIVSTYDLGYADGIFRDDGKREFSLDNQTKIIGKISMDNLSVLSGNDKVCVIKDAGLWAKRFNTITYEILAKLSTAIKREIL